MTKYPKNCSLRMADGGSLMTRWANKVMQPVAAPTPVPADPNKPAGIRFADGGSRYMNGYANGGRVVGPGTGISDSVPARYSNGEYVLPADTARAIGYDKLDDLRDATHTSAAVQRGLRDGADDGSRSQNGTAEPVDDIEVNGVRSEGEPNNRGSVYDYSDNPSLSRRPVLRLSDGGTADPYAFMGAQRPSPDPYANMAGQRPAPPKPSMMNPLNWEKAFADAGTTAAAGTVKGAQVGTKVLSEAGKLAATGVLKLKNPILNAADVAAGHGNAYFDEKIPFTDKLRIGATDLTSLAGGAAGTVLGGAFGGGIGTAVAPGVGTVAGAVAGGLGGSHYGQSVGQKAGNFLFGGDDAQRRNGYDPERGSLDIAKDALKNGVSDDLFGGPPGRAKLTTKSIIPGASAAEVPGVAPAASATNNPYDAANKAKIDAANATGAGDATMPGQDPRRVTLRGQGGTDIAGGATKFVQNGKTTYTNVTGGDNDKFMSNKPGVSVIPGMSRQAIDAALGGQSADTVSRDNMIRAANLRDGVNMERGTSVDPANNEKAQLKALAFSPIGTPGKNYARKRLSEMATDETTRRSQDIDLYGKDLTARAAENKVKADKDAAERIFKAGRDDAEALRTDKVADNKRAGGKAFDDRVLGLAGVDKDNKPNVAAASQMRTAANAFLASKIAEADAALAKDPNNMRARAIKQDIEKNGLEGIDEDTLRKVLLGVQANQVAKAEDGWRIFGGGKAVNTTAPVKTLREEKNILLPNQYVTDNGQRIPKSAVEDNPDLASLIRK